LTEQNQDFFMLFCSLHLYC